MQIHPEMLRRNVGDGIRNVNKGRRVDRCGWFLMVLVLEECRQTILLLKPDGGTSASGLGKSIHLT